MEEMWTPLVGYESRYLISNTNKVKSLRCNNRILKPKRINNHFVTYVLRNDKKEYQSVRLFTTHQENKIKKLPGEKWKDIKGYEGLYRVSNLGRVWGLKRNALLTPYSTVSGKRQDRIYNRVTLSKHGYRVNHTVPAIVLNAFVGPKPGEGEEYYLACHKNGDIFDNRMVNLKWVRITEHPRFMNSRKGRPKRTTQ